MIGLLICMLGVIAMSSPRVDYNVKVNISETMYKFVSVKNTVLLDISSYNLVSDGTLLGSVGLIEDVELGYGKYLRNSAIMEYNRRISFPVENDVEYKLIFLPHKKNLSFELLSSYNLRIDVFGAIFIPTTLIFCLLSMVLIFVLVLCTINKKKKSDDYVKMVGSGPIDGRIVL